MNIIRDLFFDFKYFSVYIRDSTTLVLILFLVTKKILFKKILEYLFFSNILTFTYSFMFFIGELLNLEYFNTKNSVTKLNSIRLISKILMILILLYLKIKPHIYGIILFLIGVNIYTLIYNSKKIYNCSMYEFLIIFLVSNIFFYIIYKFLVE